MKIGFLIPNLDSKGGINVVIKNLIEEFKKNNHETITFTVGKSNIKKAKNTYIINSNSKYKQQKLFNNFFSIEHNKKPFDILIANNLRTHKILSNINFKNSLYVFHNGKTISKKNIYTKLKLRLTMPKIYNNKHLIAVSQCFKENLIKQYPFIQYKSFNVIYNGFNFEKINQLANEKIKINYPYILGIGRLNKDKNFKDLLIAFSKIDTNHHLVILGEGEEKENLIKLTKQLNIYHKTHFLGWINNPYPYIKNANLVVSTSKIESFHNILIESLILKTPVISYDIKCGPSEILINNLKEYLIPFRNVKLLSEKIYTTLIHPPKIEDKLINKFNINFTYQQYLKVINSII